LQSYTLKWCKPNNDNDDDVSGVLAAFHEVSVYPKKDLPFFILFTAGLCSFTALLAVLTHQYPEPMGTFARVVCSLFAPISVINWQHV